MPTLISGSTGVNKITDGTIVDADINASAAITGSKLVMPTGSVLQVVQGTELTSQFSTTSTSFSDSGITASITPISTSSKILVTFTGAQVNTRHTSSIASSTETQLLRGSTVIYRPAAGVSDYQHLISITGAGGVDNWTMSSYEYLDSPSSTSSVTYKMQGRMVTGAYFRCRSGHITLMEIAG